MTDKKQINDWYFDNFQRYSAGRVVDSYRMINGAMLALSATEDERTTFEAEAKWFVSLEYVKTTLRQSKI